MEFRNLKLRVLPSPPIPKVNLKALTPKPVKAVTLEGHPALGIWHYSGHSREITADGFCTLRNGDHVVWKRRCISKTADGFVLEGNLTHKLEGDVLNIENRYRARRK